MFSGLSDRLPDVPDALRRGFEGSGREHVRSATQDDPRHHGSLSLLTQNSTWSSQHMVDKYKHLMSFHLKLFPSTDLSKKRKFPEASSMKLGYLEGGASGRLPWIMNEDAAGKSDRWWRDDVAAVELPIMPLGPVCASCHVALWDQSKCDMIDDFHIRPRGQMCGDSQRKHAEKCDLQRARPEPTLSMQVSDSLYLCFSVYCTSMQTTFPLCIVQIWEYIVSYFWIFH